MITVDPTIQSTQPNTPIRCSFSFRVKWARTALLRRNHIHEHVHVFKRKGRKFSDHIFTVLPDNYAERTKWGDKNSWRKHVGHKIGNLPNEHCEVWSISIISARCREE